LQEVENVRASNVMQICGDYYIICCIWFPRISSQRRIKIQWIEFRNDQHNRI